MTGVDPFETQRGIQVSVPVDLASAGFDTAVEVGRGGFGVVYRCRQADLDRVVAVKVLTADLDEDNRARFLREQRAMGRLTGHPNIVTILQVGVTDNGRLYLVMPYFANDSLDAAIRRRGPLPVDEVLALGVRLSAALAAGHRAGVVHRDVKPSNVLITDYGEPALSDFGIAHIVGGFETASGVITASPAFTAPEVLTSGAPTPAADVYSLGATLFCAITAHAPFERHSGEQLVAQFVRITTQPAPDLREHGIPEDVSVVIEHAMAPDPQDRPSAPELGRQLQYAQTVLGFAVDDLTLQPDNHDESSPRLRTRESRAKTAPSRTDPPGNLPEELTSFVGRGRELATTMNLLATSRLTTLTGIGGAGKTRLALRVAAHTRPRFPDGVWLVELGELRDGSLIPDVVGGALGLRNQSGRTMQDVIVDFVDAQQLLLVLDNCEQVVDGAANLVELLLRSCRELRILATSREALAVAGETVLRVPPLTVPESGRACSLRDLAHFDAVRLFTERATTTLQGFALTDGNRETVAGICRRLDGMPLPIELAAARLRAMSPQQILERLDDRWTLLTGGARTAPTRQQTLRLCVDWSYDLCTLLEQTVWSRLSVFAGSFELDAAESICGYDLTTPGLLDVITSLLDKSILIREESETVVRFRLLETLRNYGREKAQEAGCYDELRERHLDWYRRLSLAAEAGWMSDRQLDWSSRLEREQPNLRDTLEACVTTDAESGLRIANALWEFWNARSMFGEGRYWLDRLLAHDHGQTLERVKALYADSVLAELQGDLTVAAELVEQARAIAARAGDEAMNSYVTLADGTYAVFRGDLARACEHLEVAAAALSAPEDLTVRVEAVMMLGLAYAWSGDLDRAVPSFEEVLDITRARGEIVLQGYAQWALGVAWWQRHEHTRAVDHLTHGLRLAQSADDRLGVTAGLETLAWIANAEQNAHRAAVLMGAAENISHAVGSSSAYLPNLLAHHDDCEHDTRQALGASDFDAAHAEGATLTLLEAVDYALDEQHAP
ncbi:protein kinase domain-containing protein [Rhodococcus koreensis]